MVRGSFAQGDVVVWRAIHEEIPGVQRRHVGYTIAMVVVDDGPDSIALLQTAGSPYKARSGRRRFAAGKRALTVPGGWDGTYMDKTWARNTVRVHDVAQGYSVIRDWNSETGAFQGWYVNLELPWRRTPVGFDTRDLVLDVRIDDDLGGWGWKDEEELEWSQEMGLMSAETAALARVQGKSAVADIEARRNLFDVDRWAAWAPPSLGAPAMPAGWAVLY